MLCSDQDMVGTLDPPPECRPDAGRHSQYGRSQEKRSDCPLVTFGLTLDTSGVARRVDVLPSNARGPDTLKAAIKKLNGADPTVTMDTSIATEAYAAYLKAQILDWICVQQSKTPLALKRQLDEVVETKSRVIVQTRRLAEQGDEQRI